MMHWMHLAIAFAFSNEGPRESCGLLPASHEASDTVTGTSPRARRAATAWRLESASSAPRTVLPAEVEAV